VPLTSNTERLYPREALATINGKMGKAMSDQIMTSDKARLRNQNAQVNEQLLARDIPLPILVSLGSHSELGI
jgi:mRNA interferase MazF